MDRSLVVAEGCTFTGTDSSANPDFAAVSATLGTIAALENSAFSGADGVRAFADGDLILLGGTSTSAAVVPGGGDALPAAEVDTVPGLLPSGGDAAFVALQEVRSAFLLQPATEVDTVPGLLPSGRDAAFTALCEVPHALPETQEQGLLLRSSLLQSKHSASQLSVVKTPGTSCCMF